MKPSLSKSALCDSSDGNPKMIDPIAWREEEGAQVCICGISGRTPLGLSAAASAAAIRGSMSAIGAHPIFLDKMGEPVSMARDAELDPQMPIDQRLNQMLIAAIADVIETLPRRPDFQFSRRGAPLSCFVAVPEPRPGLPEYLEETLAAAVFDALAWPPISLQVPHRGHAAGLMGMQLAAQKITSGEMQICIVAGVDSYHDALSLAWLDRQGALMSEQNRNGFPPSEGAGACLIASRAFAEARGLPILARIKAATTAREPHPMGANGVCIGEGLTAALKAVSEALLPEEAVITETYCDLNGQRYRNEEYVYALLRVQEAFRDAHEYECPADCWGDMGAATGPLLASLTICASQRGYAKGSFPVAWAGSNSGDRAAVLFAFEFG